MEDEMTLLNWIQKWFFDNCDGDWEHNKNFVIETLDNPGWSVFVNLEGTFLESRSFSTIDITRSENDWLYCVVEKNHFKSACGPMNLIEALKIFIDWARARGEGSDGTFGNCCYKK